MKNNEYEAIVYFYLQNSDTDLILPKMEGKMLSLRRYIAYQKLLHYYQKEQVLLYKRESYGVQIIFCRLKFGRKYMQNLSTVQVEKLIHLALKNIKGEITIIADVWFEPELASYLQKPRIQFPLPFLKEVYKHHIKDGTLMVRDGEQAEAFIWEIYEMLNYLFIFTEEEEKWGELEEFAYEHTGLIIQYNSISVHLNRGSRALHCFDFSDRVLEEYRILPKGTIYMDFAATKEKQRVLEGKRKDVTYVSFPKCLDTCVTSAL